MHERRTHLNHELVFDPKKCKNLFCIEVCIGLSDNIFGDKDITAYHGSIEYVKFRFSFACLIVAL